MNKFIQSILNKSPGRKNKSESDFQQIFEKTTIYNQDFKQIQQVDLHYFLKYIQKSKNELHDKNINTLFTHIQNQHKMPYKIKLKYLYLFHNCIINIGYDFA